MFEDNKSGVALTIFHGGKDRALAREIETRFDPRGISTKIIDKQDGTQVRYKSRAGFPEIVTTTDEPADTQDFVRGYVANIRSLTLDMLGEIWSAIVRRDHSGDWIKSKKSKLFGPYIVSKTSTKVPSQTVKPFDFPDVWINYDNKKTGNRGILFFLKNKMFRRSIESSDTALVDWMPAILFGDKKYKSGSTDENDNHIFLLAMDGVDHCTWRDSSYGVVYESSELDAGTSGYSGEASASGISYSLGLDRIDVGFSKSFTSSIGNVLQRARNITLVPLPPYFSLGQYVDEHVQGFIYTSPTGSPSYSYGDTWLNPIEPTTNSFALIYQGSNGGTYSFSGFLPGVPTQDPTDCSSTTTSYNPSPGGYTRSVQVGWFGSQLTADISVSITANYTSEDSTGSIKSAANDLIAYGAYGATDRGPDVPYIWMQGFAPTTFPGTLGATLSTGTTLHKSWGTTTTALCVVDGRNMIRMEYMVSGNSLHAVGQTGTESSSRPWNGAAIGWGNPLEYPYVEAWASVPMCDTGTTSDQYAPGNFMIQVDVTQDTGSLVKTFSAETLDYILFDREQHRYVYLKGVFTTYSVELRIVVEVDGVLSEKVLKTVTSPGDFPWVMLEEPLFNELGFWCPPTPFSGFAPPFCSQGQFKYGAYSEIGESTSTFLMSIPLVVQRDQTTETAPDEQCFVFNPKNFRRVFGFAGIILTAPFWNDLTNKKQIINFSDGAFEDWVGGVFQDGLSEPTTFSEVYRT